MKWHLGHLKVRFSERSGRGAMLAKFIRVRHHMQGGRSIGESNTSVSERGMSLTSRLRVDSEGLFFCAVADKISKKIFRNGGTIISFESFVAHEVSRGKPLWPAA